MFPKLICSQESDIIWAKNAGDELRLIINDISKLNNKIGTAYYSDISAIKDLQDRLSMAEKILKQLEDVESEFIQLSENNKTEKDYYIKLAYIDIAALSIYSKRDAFLNFLDYSYNYDENIYKNNRSIYEKEIGDWEMLNNKHLNSAKSRIKIIINYDSENIDAKIISALVAFYEKDYNLAINDLNNIILELEREKEEVTGFGENLLIDKRLGFLYTWLSYIYFESDQIILAKEQLEQATTFPEADKSLTWSMETFKKLDFIKHKCYDIKILPVEFPKTNNSFDKKEFTFDYDNNKKSGYKVNISPIFVQAKPEHLIEITKNAWGKLLKIEEDPWHKAEDEIKQCIDNHEKIPYKNPNNIYVLIDANNSGFSQINKEKYINRFIDVFEVINDLTYANIGWNTLVRANPENIFYRIYKIKTNLGIYYIFQNSQSFLKIFEYYNINKESIPQSKLKQLEEYFEKDPLSVINDDISYLENRWPDNLMFILTKMEVATLTEEPNKALSTITLLESKISEGAEITDTDPLYISDIYKSYLFFKLKDWRNLVLTIDKLKGYGYSNPWLNDVKARYLFIDDENNFKVK